MFERITPLVKQSCTFIQSFPESVQLYKDNHYCLVRNLMRDFFPECVFEHRTFSGFIVRGILKSLHVS